MTNKNVPLPRWLLIGTAVCILIPDMILLYHLTPIFRDTHIPSRPIRDFGFSQGDTNISMLLAEYLRPAMSMFIALSVLRRRFLPLAFTYLLLRIVVPLLLAWRAPEVITWALAPIAIHVLALVGVVASWRISKKQKSLTGRST